MEKVKEVAADPHAQHNNVTRLQGRDAYRLRVGDWRVIYESHDDHPELWALEAQVHPAAVGKKIKGIARPNRSHRNQPQDRLRQHLGETSRRPQRKLGSAGVATGKHSPQNATDGLSSRP
jgi:hypothetical protein